MKTLSVVMLVMIIGLSFSIRNFAQEELKKEKKEVDSTEQIQTQVSDDKPFNTICPVSTEDVDLEITYKYNGKTYALCCNKCLKKFKADPEKYSKRLSEDGKSIVKSK
jgi:YHS domain-containing protein